MYGLQGLHFTGWAQTGERVSMPPSRVLKTGASFTFCVSLDKEIRSPREVGVRT